MLKADYSPFRLQFRQPARTSREVMLTKETYFVRVYDDLDPERFGLGECAVFRGLGCDDKPEYESMLCEVCRNVDSLNINELRLSWPSIAFGFETALADFGNGCVRYPYPSEWSEGMYGIVINGLVWMGSIDEMRSRVAEKIEAGFKCVKLKIGGQKFDEEVAILSSLRKQFPAERLEIRLDANGAFSPDNALERLEILSRFAPHSIEQPIRQGQWNEMSDLCRKSPIPIALDEELIGLNKPVEKIGMLEAIRPAYVILKPSLCGGFGGADEWIDMATARGIGWWATSALESNVGLNAIAQWVSQKRPLMPQGLGTGLLYTNNITSPLRQQGQELFYDKLGQWKMPEIQWKN